jgi:undecaprenyl-diphosphatase
LAATGTSSGLWRRDPRSGWTVVAVGALGLFVLVTLLLMAWPFFVPLDSAVSAAIRSTRTPSLTVTAAWATSLGSIRFVLPVTLGLIVWMAVRRNWRAAVYIFMTVGVGWFLGNYVIKHIIQRPRPAGVNIAPISSDWAMPSGHTLAAFLLFATLCVLVMLNAPTGHHVKRWMAIASAVIILAVGWSRVYLGVHWFGDVVAALLFGGAWWLFTTASYFGSVTEEKRATPRISSR